jgi:hypothetical protein
MARKISYLSRNFADYRSELINFMKAYYPDVNSDLNDSSIGMLFVELNAAISDNLSASIDNRFNETQINFAQQRSSVLNMARTFGLKIPFKRPSVTIVDFSVTVPVNGDTFDVSYAPLIRTGSQVQGAGKVFETVDDIDFSSPFTTGGLPNRLVIPNFDSNNNIINYTLTKREMVVNGVTKVFKRIITPNDVKPFFEFILPDDNVLSIDSVITLDGTNFTKDPTLNQFLDFDNRWYEVDALADDKVFIPDNTVASDNAGIKAGKFVRIDRRFIREYTDLGFTRLIFGGGTQDLSSLCDFDVNTNLINKVGDFINNLSLGITPTSNQTMFVKYRVGGGSDTNLGSNILTSKGIINMVVNGTNPTINASVTNSLSVNNPIPALGGRDEPSVEEIRNLVRYNFSSQNRCVTIKDYLTRISLMDGQFGVPFRTGVFEEQNKIKIYILGLDANGKLTNSSTSTLKQNIATYLSDYRMLNDYIEITDGKIINLEFELDLMIDKQYPKSQIIAQAITEVTNYMDINKFEMGESIYLSNLIEIINNISGVLNVIDVRVYNKVGEGIYSLNEISQPYIDNDTREIDLLGEFRLFGEANALFEILDPTKNIRCRVKN